MKRFRESLLRRAGAHRRDVPYRAGRRRERAADARVRRACTGAGGAIEAVRGAFQDISAEYQTQVALAATRDQLADSEQRAEEEHLLAVRLQRAIMPPSAEPVAAAGIEVAVRYRPAGPGHLVGGDSSTTRCCCRAMRSC